MIDSVLWPSLVTARYLPSGLTAIPKGLSPSSVCVPAGLAYQPWGVILVVGGWPCGPAGVPGALGAGAVSEDGGGGAKVTLAVPNPWPTLPSVSLTIILKG